MNEEIGSAILDTLFRIEQTLSDLRDLARTPQKPGAKISREDAKMLEILLPGISEVLGDANFTVGELLHEAESYEEISSCLERSFGVAWREHALRIGKLFARAEGAVLDGFQISKVRDHRNGAVWRVIVR